MPSAERWQVIRATFEAVRGLPEADRAPALAESCSDDDDLRAEVERMLAADGRQDDRLERGAFEHLADLSLPESAAPAPPPLPKIDRYRVLEHVGGGGMGEVYRAERADDAFDHEVAIKVLRRDLGGIRFARRFQRERQVLADLRHAGIARLLDGGTTDDDRPWLAMEYVDGRPIDRYCIEHGLDIDARLRLILEVGAAVRHAHQNLVIHRDIKPGNILVTPDGTPRVIDFGIALPLALGDAATMRTTAGEILGTLAYMSPEQCTRGAGAALDVRSDVYSLGVLLYELLTGKRAHEVTTLTLVEAIEAITREPIVRPSTLAPSLRGDLETILLKALEKDPEHRYDSVAAFMNDIERYLRDDPIVARPPSTGYLARKFIRRHRTAVIVASIGLAALGATAVVAIAFAVRAEREHVRADARTADAEWHAYTGSLAAATGMTGTDPRSFRPEEAKRYLQTVPERLRGWEWFHLDARRSRSLWEVEKPRHALSVAFDPDGSRILVAHGIDGGHLETFDARTGESDWAFAEGHEHEERLPTVVWSPDGTRIATGGTQGTLHLWAPDATAPLASVDAHPTSLRGLAFAPNGGRLLTAAVGGGLAAWSIDGDAPRLLWRTKGAGARPRRTMAFSSDGTRVVVGGDGGVLRFLDAADGTVLAQVAPPDARTIACVRAVDDRVIAVDYRSRIITLDPRTLSVTSIVTPEERYMSSGGLTAVAISPSGRLVAREHHQFIVVLEAATGDVVAITSGPREKSGMSDLAFSPDERRVAVTCRDGLPLHMFSLPILPAHWAIGADDTVTHAFDQLSKLVATGRRNGVVEIHDVESGIRVQRIAAHEHEVHGLAFVGDGTSLVTASAEGLRWWDAESGRPLREATDYRGMAKSLAVDRSGRRLAYPAATQTIRIIDAVTAEPIIDLSGADSIVRALTFSIDGAQVSAGVGTRVLVWDTRTGEIIRRLGPLRADVQDVAITPGGSVLACAHLRRVFEWPPGRDEEPIAHTYRGRVWDVHCLALDHDGERLGTGASDSHPRVWSVDRMAEVVALSDQGAPQGLVSFSPDGTYFASSATVNERPLHIWSTGPAPARLPAVTVRYWYDRLDGDWPAVRSAVETDPWLLEADVAKALAIVDRLARFRAAD